VLAQATVPSTGLDPRRALNSLGRPVYGEAARWLWRR
jgi:hypothetical protein